MSDIRIQDDLYLYVNKDKLDSLEIPSDLPAAGGFYELNDKVEKIMMDEFDTLSKNNSYPSENMRKAIDLYKMALNEKRRNKLGIKPILKDLENIKSISDIKVFERRLKSFVLNGYPLPFEFGVDVDMMDSNIHCLMISGPSTILPDTTMYLDSNKNKEMMIGLYRQMATRLLSLTPLSKEEQELFINDTIEFDSIIATMVKSKEEWSEYTKMYNPYSLEKVCEYLKPFNFKKLLNKFFDVLPRHIIVADPRFMEEFNKLFNNDNFTKYIHWCYVNYLIKGGTYLSEELRDISGSYKRLLMGIKEPTKLVKFAYQLASSTFYQPVGLYYGLKYFGQEAKKDVIEMVEEIIEAYKERINSNDILSEETKKKAILKLSTMKLKMGYPDYTDPKFDLMMVNPKDNLFNCYKNIQKTLYLDNFSKLYKPVDKDIMSMPGHMVNASYNPTNNGITFPAAILQPPFYSINQTRSENLGGIGAVIGHEISHAFDNNGAKCDEKGNLNNWWKEEDFKRFEEKTKAMVEQFDGIELPWGKVNGNLIVSENIADNGGVAVTLHVMKKLSNPNYEEYFKNWARVWCLKAKEEYKSMLLVMDVHGPAILRANMPVRNFDEWYNTFDVKESDKMYIKPSKRVVIW